MMTATFEARTARAPFTISAVWQGMLLGAIMIGVGLAFTFRAPPKGTNVPVELIKASVALPPNAAKTLRLRLERRGTLVMNLTNERGREFGVRLAQVEAGKQPPLPSGSASIPKFTSPRARSYSRTARMEPGDYQLVLTNAAAETDAALEVKVEARLEP